MLIYLIMLEASIFKAALYLKHVMLKTGSVMDVGEHNLEWAYSDEANQDKGASTKKQKRRVDTIAA